MTAPAQHSGTFTADELDEIAAQREALDADFYRRMAGYVRESEFSNVYVVLDPSAHYALKRYPVTPLHHPAVATRAAHPYTSRILNSPTL